MEEWLKKRIERVFASIDVDAIIIPKAEPISDMNFHCFTGVTNANFDYATAIVFRDSIHLVVAPMEEEQAKETGHAYSLRDKDSVEVIVKALRGHKRIGVEDKRIGDGDKEELGGVPVNRIGVDGDRFPINLWNEFKGFTLVDVSKQLQEARLRKSEKEIQSMRKACKIASDVAEKIPEFLVDGMTEQQLSARIDYEMKLLGGNPSFETIVAFGKNAANPHYLTGETRLHKGTLVLCDFGAKTGFLCSDITRMYRFGSVRVEEKKMYEFLLSLQEEAVNSLKKHSVDRLMHSVKEKIRLELERLDLKGGMPHGLGHGIGFDVHEDRLVNLEKAKLPVSWVTTVEPGIYVPGMLGMRIEDDILITKEGIEILTTATKDLE